MAHKRNGMPGVTSINKVTILSLNMITVLTFSSKELPRRGPNVLRSSPLHSEWSPRRKGVQSQGSTRSFMQGLAHMKSSRSSRMRNILIRKATEATTKINRGKDPSLIGFAIESNDSLKVVVSMKNIHSSRELWRHKMQDPLMVNSQKNDTKKMGFSIRSNLHMSGPSRMV